MSEELDAPLNPVTDEEIIAEAKSFFKEVEDAENDFRKQALEDLKFLSGDQWPDDVKTQRNLDGRPCLTINRLPSLVRQVTNDQRQNRPSIKVYPVDSKADVDTAEVLQGMIKHIEYNSNADIAYDQAFEYAASCGRGFFRVITDYANFNSFDQEVIIKMIDNPFTVYFDPFSVEPDGSDAKRAMIVEDLSKQAFRTEYPDSEMNAMADWTSLGAGSEGWVTVDTCRIAEYFRIEYKKKTILLLSNGDVIDAKGTDENTFFGWQDEQKTVPVSVKDTRLTMVPIVKWYKLTSTEVLDKKEFPGECIPVIPVYGDKLNIDGKRIFQGIIRNAKDPQRMYNYWTSNETEVIALAPRAPFIGVAGQFEGYEDQWRDANKRNFPYLQYNPVNINGSMAGPPARNTYEPPVQAITQAKALSADDLKATTGIYDAALGAQGAESSGIAIQRRNAQVQVTNFHFMDNMNKSLRQAGRILIDLIPLIYDAAKTQRIIKDDGSHSTVYINKVFQEPDGENKIHDLAIGEYDVVVETGPSYATKRMEAAASIEKVVKAYPQLMTVASDILVSNMDWPGAHELSERLKKTIPPNLLDDPAKDKIPPQAQAQMEQMNGLIQQLTKQLNIQTDMIHNKKLELASRERIELAKLQMSAEETLFKQGVSSAEFTLEKQIEMLQAKQNSLMAMQPLTPDQSINPNPAGPMAAQGPGMNQQNPIGGAPPS